MCYCWKMVLGLILYLLRFLFLKAIGQLNVIESAALKAYQEAQAILDRHDSGEDVSYPVPSHISENDESQLRICEIALLKSALDSLEIIKE